MTDFYSLTRLLTRTRGLCGGVAGSTCWPCSGLTTVPSRAEAWVAPPPQSGPRRGAHGLPPSWRGPIGKRFRRQTVPHRSAPAECSQQSSKHHGMRAGLAELGAVDGQVVEPHSTLEMRAVVEVVGGWLGGDGERTFQRGRFLEKFECRDKILFHIGPEVQRTARLEHALQVSQERTGHHASLLVAFLPPRIRKVDVHGRRRITRKPLGEQPQRIRADHFGVGATVRAAAQRQIERTCGRARFPGNHAQDKRPMR